MTFARALPLALLLVALPVGAQDVGEVAARVHREGQYGSRLPVEGGPDGQTIFGGDKGAERPARPPRASPSPGLASSPLLSYVLLGLVVVAALALLVSALARRRRAPALATKPQRVPSAPLPVHAAVDLDADPDALASDGHYGDAIAAALLQGLRAVGWRPEGRARSRTAREILASVRADPRHATLAALVRVEERVAFGGEEATRARWDEARVRWRELVGGEPS